MESSTVFPSFYPFTLWMCDVQYICLNVSYHHHVQRRPVLPWNIVLPCIAMPYIGVAHRFPEYASYTQDPSLNEPNRYMALPTHNNLDSFLLMRNHKSQN
eukprot:572865_1